MKKFIAILVAGLALWACTKEAPVTETATQPLKFNLSVTRGDAPDTKAVKTGWEDGDVVFVFFTGAEAPKYLEMKYQYDAESKTGSWVQTPKNGTAEESFALSGTSGTMTAIHLPFGNDATVRAFGTTSFGFNQTYLSYYLVAEKANYEVVDGVVNGELNLTVPDGYVQFFIEDSYAEDGLYWLGVDAVKPAGVVCVNADGTVSKQVDRAQDKIPGYAYGGGYVFSGLLDSDYAYGQNYYFALSDDITRSDYFISGKTLQSHNAIKLPALDSEKWQEVGNNVTATLTYPTGSQVDWFTCNYGASVPEGAGTKYDLCRYNPPELDDSDLSDVDHCVIPTKADFTSLIDGCNWIPMSILGVAGLVAKASSGFLFFPQENYLMSDARSPSGDSMTTYYFFGVDIMTEYLASIGWYDYDESGSGIGFVSPKVAMRLYYNNN